ncbi:5-amino-6-(5-phosphoribosylamino)uracil reductase [Pseudoxanthomonas sp. GM95]|uniref:RibD family protein n=1 Tax=Pseudoxanthomonas sp. GM95 TaxID=1881043 RepID=UPI0008B5C1CF|nr:dihydrofolate reductase family protein [Pseudoxanthomonas sp. GM95]SEL90952.1 5-amino-6-(5-phosphoribosylamino)uracil reductase [Pseudoxanthomonas sp. GM95]
MRPKIICHMVSSIDGRLLADRWTPPASGIDPDIVPRHYAQVGTRLEADGLMVGSRTMAEFRGITRGEPHLALGAQPRSLPHVANKTEPRVAVVFDRKGRLDYSVDHADGDHIVAVLGHHVEARYLARLRAKGISYLFAGEDGNDLDAALRTLASVFGVRTLLLEGGARLNGAFLQAGLIDQMSLLVYPGIDGLAGMPSIFEYQGEASTRPAEGQVLRHLATKTLDGGMVWIRYAVEEDALPAVV